MKNTNKRVDVNFAGMGDNVACAEGMPVGMCERFVNVRESNGAVVASGTCLQVGTLAAGERLVAMHHVSTSARHMISAVGNELRWHGTVADDGTVSVRNVVIARADAPVISADAVGDYVVAATDGAAVVVAIYDTVTDNYVQYNGSDMVPRLLLTSSGRRAITDTVAACEFDVPVTHWQRPLPTKDVEQMAANVADAYKRMRDTAVDENYYVQPILARYAVRLCNDSYMWVSAPLLIGNGLQTASSATSAVTDGELFTGVEEAAVAIDAFKVAIVVEKGPEQWCDRLIKSIDILVTDELDAVSDSMPLDYTCSRIVNGGVVAYNLNFGLRVTDGELLIDRMATTGRWRVAACIYDLDALRRGEVRASNCSRWSYTADLPSGVNRYVVNGIGTGIEVDNATIERCSTAAARQYCHMALCSHNRRLFAAGDVALLVNPWHPSLFWSGTLKAGACRVVTETTIKTQAGMTSVVWQGMTEFVPESLCPIISYPDSRAVAMRVSVLPSGGTMLWVEVELHGLPGANMARTSSVDMQPLPLTDTGIDILPVPQSPAVYEAVAGSVVEYAEDMPLAVARVHDVCGCGIAAISATSHHTNDNIGTPLYVFAADGTYAMPYRVAMSQYSPAVAISRQVAARWVRPVASDDAVYFATIRGDVCRIDRYRVSVSLYDVQPLQMTWNYAERELWIKTSAGIEVLMPSGRKYMRTDDEYVELFHLSPAEGYASAGDGRLLDVSREVADGTVAVDLLTYPIEVADVAAVPVEVVWRLCAGAASLGLVLHGETGASCHGMTLCRYAVNGRVAAPVVMKVVSPPVRVVRLAISGTLPVGTPIHRATVSVKPRF